MAKKGFYELQIAGLTRQLPICKISDELSIAGFVIFGDVELTRACAAEMIKIMPEHDIMITAESKGIPLIYEIARQLDNERYLIARKSVKLYMKDPKGVEVHSITTAKKQELFIDSEDAALMKDKRVVIIDDVISTGESLRALEKLVATAGGKVVACMAILAEGDAKYRDDIKCIGWIPLLDGKGEPMDH